MLTLTLTLTRTRTRTRTLTHSNSSLKPNPNPKVNSIRAGRSKPGLAMSHLGSVELLARMSAACTEGAKLGSTELLFGPQRISSASSRFWSHDVGTAGAVTLLLQAAMPVALVQSALLSPTSTSSQTDGSSSQIGGGCFSSDNPHTYPSNNCVSFELKGGTNVAFSPPIDYYRSVPFLSRYRIPATSHMPLLYDDRLVLGPLLERARVMYMKIDLMRRGFYPR
jgi:RNA 3'-terminal phosphate cyclase